LSNAQYDTERIQALLLSPGLKILAIPHMVVTAFFHFSTFFPPSWQTWRSTGG